MKLTMRKGETLTGRVLLDGNRWEGCTFQSCVIEVGGNPFSFGHDNHFIEPRFTFVGSALRTIGVLQYLHQDDTTRPMIEELFEMIRRGVIPSEEETDWPRNFDA